MAHDFGDDDVEKALVEGVQLLVRQGHIKAGDRIILSMGEHTGNEGGTNTLRLLQVGEGGQADISQSLNTSKSPQGSTVLL